MEYPFITLDDGTQISHSEMLADRSVLVYIRRDALCRAVYALPAQEWRKAAGFTADELEHIKKVIVKMTPLILEFSQKGGFRGASGLVAFGHCFHLHHEYQNNLHRPQSNGARAGGLFGNNRRIPAHPDLCLPRRYFPRFSPQPNTQALVKWFEHGKRAGKAPLLPTNTRQARTVCPVMI